MIIPTLSEDRILEELLFDRKIMANEAKKLAKKEITRQKKAGRDGIDKDIFIYKKYETKKNHNKWILDIIINMANEPKWSHQAICVVESERGTQDFYYVRGFSNKKPYFIKVSSHALKRFKERGIEKRINEKATDAIYFAAHLFAKGEIITYMKVAEPEFWGILLSSEDANVVTTMFFTLLGCFLGYETEKGNYDFRTLISNNDIPKKKGEAFAWSTSYIAHVAFNKKLYNKVMYSLIEKKGIHIDLDKFKFILLP